MLRPREGTLFASLILTFVLVLLAQTIGMRGDSVLMPRIIGVLLLVCTLLQLLSQWLPALARVLGTSEDPVADASATPQRHTGVFTAWLVCFLAAAYMLGMIAAIVVALFFYLRFCERQGWRVCILYPTLFAAAVYLVFVQAMGVHYLLEPVF